MPRGSRRVATLRRIDAASLFTGHRGAPEEPRRGTTAARCATAGAVVSDPYSGNLGELDHRLLGETALANVPENASAAHCLGSHQRRCALRGLGTRCATRVGGLAASTGRDRRRPMRFHRAAAADLTVGGLAEGAVTITGCSAGRAALCRWYTVLRLRDGTTVIDACASPSRSHAWNDGDWIATRAACRPRRGHHLQALHLGSWQRTQSRR